MDIFEKDEQDRLDESLVMYDAQNQGTFDTLIRSRNHNKLEHIISDPKYPKGYFIDDQLNYYINRLREKLGKNGQIVVVLDCCHAGTGTRGIGESKLVHRGIDNPFVPEGYSRNSSFDSTWYAVDLNHEYTEGLASLTSFWL